MGEGQLKEINGQYFMFSGDFDSNGLINNSDYNLWKVNSLLLHIYSFSDGDGNGIINSLDYNLWKVNRSELICWLGEGVDIGQEVDSYLCKKTQTKFGPQIWYENIRG